MEDDDFIQTEEEFVEEIAAYIERSIVPQSIANLDSNHVNRMMEELIKVKVSLAECQESADTRDYQIRLRIEDLQK
jgi:hypothetical protein